MPDKPLTIATYAAGASLAAITLVYVFGPTWFLDDEPSRQKGAVGLSNPANDCFINSILQVLAGLGDLRIYLIREIHRRNLDGPEVYKLTQEQTEEVLSEQGPKAWKLEGLQQGLVTKALKDVLDKLNERPLYRKTISAQNFIRELEVAFRTRISRQQQDAQEFLQIVAERLCDEYYAGRRARRRSKRLTIPRSEAEELQKAIRDPPRIADPDSSVEDEPSGDTGDSDTDDLDMEDGFPFEGKLESQIECLTCHFKPKPSVSSFVTLTLNVPHTSCTSLNNCFDGMLKLEHIDDFKCERCRLQHALSVKNRELSSCRDPRIQSQLEVEITKLETAIREDPEKPPSGVLLPDIKYAPKRRIARHMRISGFPKILAIHLSRSLYSATSLSTKNMAKVSFPETLPLGGILDQKKYKLLGLVTHKGGHNSGHYESFRRQVPTVPYSTPHSFGTGGVYSNAASPNPSAVQSPRLSPRTSKESRAQFLSTPERTSSSSPTPNSPSTSSLSSKSSLSSTQKLPPAPTSAPKEEGLRPPSAPKLGSSLSKSTSISSLTKQVKRPKKRDNRWWRISDEKVKEARTSDVLGMQKEAYLLFYELDRSSSE
ncbi:cysteine proteinase [Patellaria atrata CBS 101060]|uniref:Ubiquitin carboxyl-terminal hydrolase n=1 Tax=Patellaria atrata CBS 101060 TaxID=1346257 RepID=A0A9P4VLM2_9PEZI|nr:cysteine proteinase [Patellaria atrata CBS 101060]